MSNYISNSQIKTYNTCPYCYYLKYIQNIKLYSGSIFTIFGTSMHETIQEYLKVLFNESVKKTKTINWKKYFANRMLLNYKKEKEKNNNKDICTLNKIKDSIYEGNQIIDYFLKKRNKYFSTRKYELLEIEEELLVPIGNNLNFKGYLDIVLKNKKENKIKIIDIKTSYSTWSDKKKKDKFTRMQLLFYKKYYAEKYNIDLDNIEVEFMILKRIVFDNAGWAVPRIQQFEPPNSKRTIKQYIKLLEESKNNIFDENGNRFNNPNLYPKRKSSQNCKYCSFKKTKYCDAWG